MRIRGNGRRSGRRGLAQDPAPSCGSMAGCADGVRRRRGLRRPRRCRARPPRGRSGGGSSEERSRRADAPERPAGACPARRQAVAAAREPEEPDVRTAGPPPARRDGIGEDRFRNAGRRARRTRLRSGLSPRTRTPGSRFTRSWRRPTRRPATGFGPLPRCRSSPGRYASAVGGISTAESPTRFPCRKCSRPESPATSLSSRSRRAADAARRLQTSVLCGSLRFC